MILYNSKKEMIATSPEIVDFLGFESFEEMYEKIGDIAELFVNRPGYIYKFKNFSWIDYILVNDLKSPKTILKTMSSEIETELVLNELIDKNGSKYFCVSFKNLTPAETAKSIDFEEDEIFDKIHESESDYLEKNDFLIESNNILEEKDFEKNITTEKIEPENFSLKEEPFETFETKAEKEKIEENQTFNEDIFNDIQLGKSPFKEEDFETVEAKEPSFEKEIEENLFETQKTLENKIEEPITLNFDEIEKEIKPVVDKSLENEAKESAVKIYDFNLVSKELGLDKELIEELLLEFIEQAYELKPQIKEALNNEDYTLAHNLIHKIKGAAANLRINEANEILSGTAGIDDKKILSEIMDRFYDFIDRLNKELFPNLTQKIDYKTFEQEEEKNFQKSENTEKEKFTYNPKIASDELGIPEDAILEFVLEYIKQSFEFETDLKNYIENRDFENLKNLLHKLKGTATNLRIKKADDILSKALKSKNLEEISDLIDTFYKILNEISKELDLTIEKSSENIFEVLEDENELENTLKDKAKNIGIDLKNYKTIVKEFIYEIEEILKTDNQNKIKTDIKKFASLAENLGLDSVKEKICSLISSTKNDDFEKNLNDLKNILSKIKPI